MVIYARADAISAKSAPSPVSAGELQVGAGT